MREDFISRLRKIDELRESQTKIRTFYDIVEEKIELMKNKYTSHDEFFFSDDAQEFWLTLDELDYDKNLDSKEKEKISFRISNFLANSNKEFAEDYA